MTFKNGREAVLFYVKARMNGFVCAGTEYIMEDEGHNLQYDSNILPLSPTYTIIVETLVDLEKIFKDSLSYLEIQFILAWGANSATGEDEFPENPTADEFQALTRRGQAYRYLQILAKIEGGLRKFKYLDHNTADQTRFKAPRRIYNKSQSIM